MVKNINKEMKTAIVEPIPDKRKLTKRQAIRLAEMANVEASELRGKTIALVHEKLKWQIDPQLLLFRRICGQVVKRNPATGALEAVPNATVHIEDTDCSFLSYFPSGSPWCWFFPLICHREEIATVKTDHCGRFCVWIPRWEIDWIWKWRKGRICFPYFYKPPIWEILEDLELLPEPPILRKPPFPPDPPPFAKLKPGAIERVRETLGTTVAAQLRDLVERQSIGESVKELDVLLNMHSPITMPPPLPAEMGDAAPGKDVSDTFANIALDERYLRKLDYSRYIGPFRRCVDVYYKEWVPFFDVPDITFRVTQDVDDDGTEETIYSEGFFDVRWNSGSIPNIVLEASTIALSTPICDGPVINPNECTKPTIVTAGLMPLKAPYHDKTSGYALKINRPLSGGLSSSPHIPPGINGKAPYWRTVQLHGCQRFNNAKYYRLIYSYEGNAYVPFTGEKWLAPKLVGPPFWVVHDTNGWYEVLPVANLVFPYWLINWQTWRYPNGKYTVKIQIANNAKTVIGMSDPVSLVVDNKPPTGGFNTIRWRAPGVPGYSVWQTLNTVCPIIRRPKGKDIELKVDYHASAPHFRNVNLFGRSCEGVFLSPISTIDKFNHWHTNTGDNTWNSVAVFEVPGTMPEGAYTVGLNIHGRAFNPAGGDAGPGSNWHYDVSYSHSYPRRHIAIIDL